MKLVNELQLPGGPVEITCEDATNFGTKHHFEVVETATGKSLSRIDFQEGPVKEAGVNGVQDYHLLQIIRERLVNSINSKYTTHELELALDYVEAAIMQLNKRTVARQLAKKEGTSQV